MRRTTPAAPSEPAEPVEPVEPVEPTTPLFVRNQGTARPVG